jgi:hypothetical protein
VSEDYFWRAAARALQDPSIALVRPVAPQIPTATAKSSMEHQLNADELTGVMIHEALVAEDITDAGEAG